MFSMARNALVLFFSGRLFADQRKAVALIAIGVLVTALICVMLVKAGGISLVAAAAAAGFIGGGLQPLVLKRIKFR
jgi:hypothetical protein